MRAQVFGERTGLGGQAVPFVRTVAVECLGDQTEAPVLAAVAFDGFEQVAAPFKVLRSSSESAEESVEEVADEPRP